MSADRVLDCGRVVELAACDGDLFAATRTGLFHSIDGGVTWDGLDVPQDDIWSVHWSHDGRLFVGTYPARLYVSRDQRRWSEVEDFQSASERGRWYCPGDPDHGRVRTIRTVPKRPDRLLVGVEVGGLYVSDDRGKTWMRHDHPIADDVHHVNVQGPDEYVVCCGKRDLEQGYSSAGAFRTTNGGKAWERLELGEYSYTRESLVHNGTMYVSGARNTPGDWGDDRGARATLFESPDIGSTVESVAYPGEPTEIVLSWAVDDDVVYGGTGTRAHNQGRVIRRYPDSWADLGTLPGNVYSLTAI